MKKIFFLPVLMILVFIGFTGCSKAHRISDILYDAGKIEGLRSIIVSEDEKILGEKYFGGASPEAYHHVLSVTKSILSTLVGIAIDQGYISSVEQTVGDFIKPEVYPVPEDKKVIKIKDLLTMSSGIPWESHDLSMEYMRLMNSPDQLKMILDRPMAFIPGTRFNYSDGTAHLMSIVLSEAIGMNVYEFAKKNLFEPLGFGNTQWDKDKRGYNFGGVRLFLIPRDMLKIGYLFLNKGQYNGKRIVSEKWVEESTSPKINTGSNSTYNKGYGYYWWCGTLKGSNIYFANGFAGQFIIVIPDRKIVVTATSNGNVSDEESGRQWNQVIQFILYTVVPEI